MAAKRKTAKGASGVKIEPGARTAAGIICRVTDDGCYLGREAEAEEACPAGHTEHTFGELRAFLSDHQAPISVGVLRGM